MVEEGTGRGVLIDFGLCTDENEVVSTREGTLGYLAPEGLKGPTLVAKKSIDVYAFACTIVAAFSGMSPFNVGGGGLNTMRRQLSGEIELSHNFPEGLVSLIGRCLVDCEKSRPTMNELLLGLVAAKEVL